ncbi:hypothetical protein P692DRAFT_20647526, partial [Suillus brevipes Sb2]
TCPKCGRTFTKESSVARHLSQPRSSCHSHMCDIVDILQFTEVVPPQCRAGDDTNSIPEHDNIDDEFRMFGDSLEEEYDGAGACCSQDGSTFLDLFDANEYAECRVDNLYYLFASKEEWDIADYLLRSSLSMAAI